MSNVRLSNGSPTLERMEARQADYPKPSACRNLFGPVDHAELARELQQHSRDLEAASRAKWNFDFQRDQPLRGRYEWRALAKPALPDFYSRAPRRRSAAPRAKPSGGSGNCPAAGCGRSRGISGEEEEEEEEDAAAAAEREAEAAAAATGAQTDFAGRSAGQRKRPASDDSSPQNKRANTTEEPISEDSPSASSVEQTPKKSSPRQPRT
ncbi:cyclin-dependent kinase inhibitor 1B [Elgaria multicarinata webbii]|uniref:cyclin-dependent kinase inhibitor 1B n=1 Tax=Elgaria multicarinata webbii TaxID=159646 RepID=UPI002FCCFE89